MSAVAEAFRRLALAISRFFGALSGGEAPIDVRTLPPRQDAPPAQQAPPQVPQPPVPPAQQQAPQDPYEPPTPPLPPAQRTGQAPPPPTPVPQADPYGDANKLIDGISKGIGALVETGIKVAGQLKGASGGSDKAPPQRRLSDELIDPFANDADDPYGGDLPDGWVDPFEP